MDAFSRTFLPVAVVWTGVAIQTVNRQLPVLRRCVEADDSPVLLTRCARPGRASAGDHLLLLTHRRLVVTRQTSVLHRVRLHLNMELRHLGDVIWHPDDRLTAVELAATAVDGVRERFLIRVAGPGQVWRLDTLLEGVFRPDSLVRRSKKTVPPVAPPAAPPRVAPGARPPAGLVAGPAAAAATGRAARPSRHVPTVPTVPAVVAG